MEGKFVVNNVNGHQNGCEATKEARQKETGLSTEEQVYEKIVSLVKLSEDLHNRRGSDHGPKVVNFVQPSKLIATYCSGDMAIRDEGMENESQLKELICETLKLSVKTDHLHYYNSLSHGPDFYGKIGNLVNEVMNTNAYTYEVAPVFSIVERELVAFTAKKFGWTGGDGLTCPGGSIANMYGIMLARHNMFPRLKKTGLCGSPPLVIYTSDQSHYSIEKAANWLGIGLDNVKKIPTNSRGQMLMGELDKAINRTLNDGHIPLAVNATLGSTVVGAFDDLKGIHDVLRKYSSRHDIWLHGDAAWGGAYAFSPALKTKYMPDTYLCDSIAWNPHKMIGAPLQGSIFLHRKMDDDDDGRSDLLKDANCAAASYLFQQDKVYDASFDSGDKAVQCGRKPDAFKIWLMLKVRGESFVRQTVETAHAMSRLLVDKINAHENFQMVLTPSCTNVNFVYIPPILMRNQPFHEIEDEEWKNKISHVVAQIKGKMVEDGWLMIAYQPLKSKNLKNFFRMVFHSQPIPTKKDVQFVMDEIHRLGKGLQ